MAVQDTVRTVSVPRQGGPVDPPLAAPADLAPAAPRQRPGSWSHAERGFALGLLAMWLVLETVIVVGLLLYELVGT